MRTIRTAFIIVIVAIGVAATMWWRQQRPAIPSRPQVAAVSTTAPATSNESKDPTLTPEERNAVGKIVARARDFEAQRFSTDRLDASLRKAANAGERRLVLAALQDRRYPRDD